MDAKFFDDLSGDAEEACLGRMGGMDRREVHRVDPILVDVEEGAEAHGISFYRSDGLMGYMITHHGDRLAEAGGEIAGGEVEGWIIVDEDEGIGGGKSEQFHVIIVVLHGIDREVR